MESWAINKTESYLYTDSFELAKQLKSIYKRCATYERGGKTLGWQFLIPSSSVKSYRELNSKIAKSEALIYNDLQPPFFQGSIMGDFLREKVAI